MVRDNKKTLQIDFNDGNIPHTDYQYWPRLIIDRGSVYAVAIGLVQNEDDMHEFLTQVKREPKHQTATHHSYAARMSRDGTIIETKNDDGETGAGNVILRILQKKNMMHTAVCVIRWYGGVKLEGDRFKHIQDATIYAVELSH